jgi:uncharacterized protein (TIGR03437 family)
MRVFLYLIILATGAAQAQTGTAVPAFSGLDGVMNTLLARFQVRGGALAVVQDDHLLFARGYGWADVEGQQLVQPDSLFRVGSISKTLTAAAVMRLVEDGKLDLDTPVFSILNQYTPYNGRWGDSRLHSITVRQLLHHTGGWDRDASGDPVIGDRTVDASNATHTAFPPTADTVISYMLSKGLDFGPGSRYAYSNFGYVLLGRVIEKLSGKTYRQFMNEQVLEPMGLTNVQIGGSTLAARLPGEVKYYDYPGAPSVSSFLSPWREKEPRPYAVLDTDLVDSAGGWVASVVDLAKFVAMLDGARPRSLLRADTFAEMIAQTPRNTWMDSINWYGFGIVVYEQLGGVTWLHNGANYGTRACYWRFANGLSFVLLFNGDSKDQSSLSAEMGQDVWDALAAVPADLWPQHDLFPQFYPPRIAPGGVVNAASLQPGAIAPESLFTIFGVDLGGRDADVAVTLRDGSGTEQPVEIFYSGPGQLNGLMPEGAIAGERTLTARREGWPDAVTTVKITDISPGLFVLNADGLVAASLVRAKPGEAPVWDTVYQTDDGGHIVAKPIAFGAENEELVLVLYATGLRGAGSGVTVQAGGFVLTPGFAGAQAQYPGLDQVNVALPRELSGAGTVTMQIQVNGMTSNPGMLLFR